MGNPNSREVEITKESSLPGRRNCPVSVAARKIVWLRPPAIPPPSTRLPCLRPHSSAPHSPRLRSGIYSITPGQPLCCSPTRFVPPPQLEPVFTPALLLASLNRFGIRSSFNGVLTDLLIDFTGCSTVLLPTRIVHALNLNVEDINSQPRTQCGRLPNTQFSAKHTMFI